MSEDVKLRWAWTYVEGSPAYMPSVRQGRFTVLDDGVVFEFTALGMSRRRLRAWIKEFFIERKNRDCRLAGSYPRYEIKPR